MSTALLLVVTPCVIMAGGMVGESVSAHQKSAEEAIAGALANVKSRYRARLDRLGLIESYFDETSGICDLMLIDVGLRYLHPAEIMCYNIRKNCGDNGCATSISRKTGLVSGGMPPE